jgi:hypothetical protein
VAKLIVKEDNSYRIDLINSKEKTVTENFYNEISKFTNERAMVGKNGKFDNIDLQGKEVIPTKFNQAERFNRDCAPVGKGRT